MEAVKTHANPQAAQDTVKEMALRIAIWDFVCDSLGFAMVESDIDELLHVIRRHREGFDHFANQYPNEPADTQTTEGN